MVFRSIEHSDYTVEIETPKIYIDNEARGKSGHMSHALALYADGTLIDFNSCCSGERFWGHSAFGYVEFALSEDGGDSYSERQTVPYTMETLLGGVHSISIEKAVACPDGALVAFCLRNDQTTPISCEPWSTPTVILSYDKGKNWNKPYEMCHYRGRIYDAVFHNGSIYALFLCNENFLGTSADHKYRIYKSDDFGKSFYEHCTVPFSDVIGRGYGSLLIDGGGKMHVYAYNSAAECELDHIVSNDLGISWEECPPCFLEKGIRNPQTALIDGIYILHGRGMNDGNFIFYSSRDGYIWDCGVNAGEDKRACYYSNSILLRDGEGKFLLVQYSDAFRDCRVNVMHTKLRIKRK